MGYELTATDLDEMLHGEFVTSDEKVLTSNRDGKETSFRARLMLSPDYKVQRAPKIKSKKETDEACPKCSQGKLVLITSFDDSQWYGCNQFPACKFYRPFVPHTFAPQKDTSTSEPVTPCSKAPKPGATPAAVRQPTGNAPQGLPPASQTKLASPKNEEAFIPQVLGQSKQSAGPEEPDVDVPEHAFTDNVVASTKSLPPDAHGAITPPAFVRRLLKLPS